jgi:hypothetical protein
MPATYPWRDGRTVTEVIHANRDTLVRAGIIESGGGGCSAAEIDAVHQRVGRDLPADVRELYACARPRHPTATHFPGVALFAPGSEAEVRWYDLLGDAPQPIDLIKGGAPVGLDDFADAEGFMLGGTPYFDRLFWVRGHARLANGCVVLTDHEDDYALPVVARSLAEYLARLCFFGGVDLAAYPGARKDVPLDHALLFAREFVELNPRESGRGLAAPRPSAPPGGGAE